MSVMLRCVLLLLLVPLAQPAAAQRHWPESQAQGPLNMIDNWPGSSANRRENISEGEAVRIAQQRYGGKVVKVERSAGVYYVRLLLPNGRVKLVVVNASNGAVSD